MTLTTGQAADLLGVSELTIRSWVKRDQLKPVRPGANPLRFRESDVVECHYRRQPKTWHRRFDRIAEEWSLTAG